MAPTAHINHLPQDNIGHHRHDCKRDGEARPLLEAQLLFRRRLLLRLQRTAGDGSGRWGCDVLIKASAQLARKNPAATNGAEALM